MSNGNEILVEVRGVSKKFSRNLKRSLIYGLQDIARSFFGVGKENNRLRKSEFWAVKDISFQLRRGECLGLIGHNGAGKSTLLKMLNGLIRPDEGEIIMRGRIGALIELGAGFNPVLTGRENIYINGQVLGFSKKEIGAKMNKIIEFAEIADFIDTPVQNYSSGMKVRLGFAVAAQMEPDVLIIDEVLAVGDLGFRLKCFDAMDRMMKNSAIIFVSHSMPMISRMCDNVVFMDKGESFYQGDNVSTAIDKYYEKFITNKGVIFQKSESAVLDEITIVSNQNVGDLPAFNWHEDISVELKINIKKGFENLVLSLIIFDKEQRPIGICFNEDIADITKNGEESGDYMCFKTKVTLPKTELSKGLYSVNITLSSSLSPLFRVNNAAEFMILHEKDIWQPLLFEGKWE